MYASLTSTALLGLILNILNTIAIWGLSENDGGVCLIRMSGFVLQNREGGDYSVSLLSIAYLISSGVVCNSSLLRSRVRYVLTVLTLRNSFSAILLGGLPAPISRRICISLCERNSCGALFDLLWLEAWSASRFASDGDM